MHIITYLDSNDNRWFVHDYRGNAAIVSRTVLFAMFSKRAVTVGLQNTDKHKQVVIKELIDTGHHGIETWSYDNAVICCLLVTPIVKPRPGTETYDKVKSEPWLHYYLCADKAIAFVWDNREIVNLIPVDNFSLEDCDLPTDNLTKLNTGYISHNVGISAELAALLDSDAVYETSKLLVPCVTS